MARKILLADDSVTAQNMGRKILADAGYEVITVNNGSAALKRITEQRPDVIVLDVYMPGYSGLEVCQRLKEVGETSRIPILLTVGKLEPFKPEEVKRVRADAFIIKPFEASELLSALSKLEDRIVPQAEGSKPGRFGRAAIEAPYDKMMTVEQDTGWKDRINFPHKKKEEEPEPEEQVSAKKGKEASRAVDKKVAESPASPKHEERVDLGALAPAGLPKDVTPEEIAALAAAAAQIQGGIAASQPVPPAPAVIEPPKIEAPPQGEIQSKTEVKEEAQAELPKVEAIAPPAAAEAVVEAKQAQVEAKEADAPAPSSFADQILTSANAEPSKSSASSGNGSWPQEAFEPKADEPVTMAVTPAAEPKPHSARWTAVAATLAPEEAALSLEQEMAKAHAAFAAAEDGHAEPKSESAPVHQIQPVVEGVEPVVAASVAAPAPEITQPLAATETTTAKVEEPAVSATEKHEPSSEVKSALSEPATTTAAAEMPVEPFAVAAPSAFESQIVEQSAAKQPATAEQSTAAENSEERAVVSELKSEPETASIAAKEEPRAEPELQDADRAAATAAVLAMFQKTGGSGDGKSAESAEPSEPRAVSQDTAAKAVAVGAESHPEDVSPSDSDSVASIVDSVLADLRPKIVEEISKKLGKKK